MYNYIDEDPQEIQDKTDEFFKKDPCNKCLGDGCTEICLTMLQQNLCKKHKRKEEHTFVVDITTGFKTGFETHVKTVQVESRKELYELLEKWMRRSTADGCEFNYNISDCGGHDIPADQYETMENIYSDGKNHDLPF